jgi:phage-related protein
MEPCRTPVALFQEDDRSVPFLQWFEGLSEKVQDKCRVKLERLHELGHELRRPEADYLRDGIYELRVRLGRVNYRMLYFFHGDTAVVLSHGLVKEKAVPAVEIDRAVKRRERLHRNPSKHTYREG